MDLGTKYGDVQFQSLFFHRMPHPEVYRDQWASRKVVIPRAGRAIRGRRWRTLNVLAGELEQVQMPR